MFFNYVFSAQNVDLLLFHFGIFLLEFLGEGWELNLEGAVLDGKAVVLMGPGLLVCFVLLLQKNFGVDLYLVLLSDNL